ncbi:Oidioi.mRNA.OKI2018_I69.XSR.g16870.t1.cds [Oikopleura dioica]|uniref:Oidioi.mRNA.OKI2018_I69.XSR.g16870.t1.cds n=1 Tax=Oikopleura dioica TaxID=34765 RepID=A0ABN7SNS4_OIKDI|nr:Oidioi.mRNA.OKI2018_I69.XSR.g16870.t1.cds [Oikopleura dioica]
MAQCRRNEVTCGKNCPCEENCPFGCPCQGWCEEKLPSGVQQDIPLEKLRNLGYEPYYQELFGVSPTDEDMDPEMGGDYLFIGCKERNSDSFNAGIFGAKKFLLELQEFENSPSMISKATEHNGFYYYNTNSLSYCGPNKIFGFSPIENIYPFCADYYDCKYQVGKVDVCEEHEWDNTRMSVFKNDRNWAGWRCGRFTEYDGYVNQLSWLWENFELQFWTLKQ